MTLPDEAGAVRERYARRAASDPRYSLLDPAALMAQQERQRVIANCLRERHGFDLSAIALLDVGCGGGGLLLDMLRFGMRPENLCGIELLAERHAQARAVLPAGVRLSLGEASEAIGPLGSFDIVLQSTVFSSLLDPAFQQRLAAAMWAAVKPGGAVLWYDLRVDNPRNPDVRGVPLRRVRELFPAGRIASRRLTLAPPIARAAARVHPALYTLLNALPLLRTHVLAWIAKPIQ